MAIFGRWNWWLPRPFARLVRVAPSPLDRSSGDSGNGTPTRRRHHAARYCMMATLILVLPFRR